jgi:hypothetical protein
MTDSTLLATALRTKRQYGVGLLRQLWQATRLRFGPGRLDPWEYFFFRVFLDRYAWEEKRRFFGWRGEVELDHRLNHGPDRDVANDKLKFDACMRAIDAPVARALAVYSTGSDRTNAPMRLSDGASMARYLAQTPDLPLFIKPLRGAHGWGATAIVNRDEAGEVLELGSGERVVISDFITGLEAGARRGYLIQEKLIPHPAIAEICGDRLTSARIVVLNEAQGATILSAVWRVPTGTNMTDNFSAESSGNLCGAIDLASGSVGRVFQGVGWELRPLDAHPDTGAKLIGFCLPDWRRAADLSLACAAELPGLGLQHWDVALTDRGPVLLELNVMGGLRTHQIVAAGPENLRPLAKIMA